MLLYFTKMHGLGNDFMVVDLITQRARLTPEQIRALSHRRLGIGFDQLLVVEPPLDPDMDFRYRIYNADGNEVESCGNGARCFARFVRDQRLTHKREIHVETAGGPLTLHVEQINQIRVDMGQPQFAPAAVAYDASQDHLTHALEVDGQTHQISIASMGNPHAVLHVDNVDTAPVDSLGPAIGKHPRFANGVNVGFMQVISPQHIRLRVFERGSGETLACGTGACAAVACGIRQGLLKSPVQVQLPGGKLEVSWPAEDQPLTMRGPAERVFSGRITLN
ncbi:MAG: diaminopimelate epimerase [Halomonas sp.]|uniref:diaminopimelate epimerase n=1 Tax=Halomonas sp. TaxID=1486246 RepID=UPI003F924B26